MTETSTPRAFISYSWDGDAHKSWVKQLATRLRTDGVDVTLDQWNTVPGDQLPAFMEKAIRENDFVLVICTPLYKEKSDNRRGGVGYEGDIMTGEIFAKSNHPKFIPVLRQGDWNTTPPTWLAAKYGIDFRADSYNEAQYEDLLTTLHNIREQAPPIGPRPSPEKSPRRTSRPQTTFEPIKILGIVADQVGTPRNDGTRGCALYEVPFKLSRRPSSEWEDLFIKAWDHPPTFTTMHRPGIAEIVGDRIILRRTTIEEVRDSHRETLKLAVNIANEGCQALQAQQRAAEEAEADRLRQHAENVRRTANEIDFD